MIKAIKARAEVLWQSISGDIVGAFCVLCLVAIVGALAYLLAALSVEVWKQAPIGALIVSLVVAGVAGERYYHYQISREETKKVETIMDASRVIFTTAALMEVDRLEVISSTDKYEILVRPKGEAEQ